VRVTMMSVRRSRAGENAVLGVGKSLETPMMPITRRLLQQVRKRSRGPSPAAAKLVPGVAKREHVTLLARRGWRPLEAKRVSCVYAGCKIRIRRAEPDATARGSTRANRHATRWRQCRRGSAAETRGTLRPGSPRRTAVRWQASCHLNGCGSLEDVMRPSDHPVGVASLVHAVSFPVEMEPPVLVEVVVGRTARSLRTASALRRSIWRR